MERHETARIDVRAAALACGLTWGFGVFFLAWWLMLFEGATGEPTLVGRIYRGFSLSPSGSVIGLLWGFADGAAGGAVLAWLYNALRRRAKPEDRT